VTARFSCAAAANARNEPCHATASTVRRWLLIEQPGPWGASAIRESRMPSVAAEALIDLGKRLSARVLLIRRPGGRISDGTHVYVAHTGVRSRWLQSFVLEAPQAVLDLDLEPLRRGQGVDGRPEDDPLLLVCTNGRHDPCCAEFGRPVADALATGSPATSWRCPTGSTTGASTPTAPSAWRRRIWRVTSSSAPTVDAARTRSWCRRPSTSCVVTTD
jgi:hypothetical protein